ncbi:unnamed protein product, partial [Phaeothamnion confervicola]
RIKSILDFSERVQREPNQCVRYAWGGRPLWSTAHPPSHEPPPCCCGAPRVFEMQLMPALLLALRVDEAAATGSSGEDGGGRYGCTGGAAGTVGEGITGSAANGSGGAGGEDAACQRDVEKRNCASSDTGGDSDNESESGSATGLAAADAASEVIAEAGPSAPTAAAVARVTSRGMEWGVVAVWSCAASCDESVEEVAIAQPEE